MIKIILLPILVLILGFLALFPVVASFPTTVSLEPASQTVSPGQTFEVDVFLDLGSESRGAQFDLTFDQASFTCNSVTEGNLYSLGDTQPTQWREPVIDNRGNGAIIGAACVIVAPAVPVSSSGVLATISFTSKDTLGVTELELSNVIVGDAFGDSVEVLITGGGVTVGLVGDVNGDGRVNILDMIIVGANWTG